MTQEILSTTDKVLKQAISLGYQSVCVPRVIRDQVTVQVSSQKVTIKKNK